MNKKLILIATFGLHISFNGLAMESNKSQISDFNPERDTQSVVDLFKKEERWLGRVPEEYILDLHHKTKSRRINGILIAANCHIKVLHENNDLAGCIVYKSTESKHIDYLAIENNFRNKGYGKALLKHAIDDLSHKGPHSTIEVITTPHNIRALNLYEKCGFKKRNEWATWALTYDPIKIQDDLFDQHAKAYQY
ncbi:MAG TPA: GNAT family N-acetyltransferase [Candidatus Babeliales bacterium]|jgi:ribosomal protein S18 acetylase RimI-like enzyme|nr:GNAT family N-acetyltransferase [Candidatus Babeliales bacterium]